MMACLASCETLTRITNGVILGKGHNPVWPNMATMQCYHALVRERRVSAARKAAVAGSYAVEELVSHFVFRADPQAKPHLAELRSCLIDIDWDHLVARLSPDRTLPLVHLKLDDAGKCIRYWREKRHLTQAELGAQIGVTDTYIASLENGAVRLRPEKLDAMAKALGISSEIFAKAMLKFYHPEYHTAIFASEMKAAG